MRLIKIVIFTLSICLWMAACEEVGPPIDLTGNFAADTSYVTTDIETPDDKVVLLEEFTGVRCPNCPDGHAILASLEAMYGNRIVIISEHSPSLANPYPGEQDLRTDEAQNLETMLGGDIGKPHGTVDRIQYTGEPFLLLYRNKWGTYVDERLTATTPVNIDLIAEFDDVSGVLSVIVTLHFTESVTGDLKITVFVKEDGIHTTQKDVSNEIEDYEQEDVLRATMTPFNGNFLNDSIVPGRVIVSTFTMDTIPMIWDAQNLEIVAAVHRSTPDLTVLQAAEVEVE